MDKIIAYCGIICSDCPAYIATQANDWPALERLAAEAREKHNQPDATAEGTMCDGCLSGPHKCGYCAECAIRACGIERGVANCAHCADYPCEKLLDFFGMVPDARVVLEQVRQELSLGA